jgi:hypothetical protein
MTQPWPEPRRFSVYTRDLGIDHARMVEASSVESAAVAYIEHLHGAPAEEISIVVRDVETGHDHCFRIDLTTGDTTACG